MLVLYSYYAGIGQILNLRFNDSFSAIMWDPPPTVGVLSNLTYHLTVTMSTDAVIINTTTTNTSYSIIDAAFCTLYTSTVIASSLEGRSNSATISEKTPGSN